MEVMAFLEILKTIGGAAGALITLTTLWGLVSKKPKLWLKNTISEQNKEDNLELKELMKSIDEKLHSNNATMVCLLRHSITDIYQEYKEKKEIPAHVKQDLCSLYEDYHARGGNSYVHTIYEEMMDWEVK